MLKRTDDIFSSSFLSRQRHNRKQRHLDRSVHELRLLLTEGHRMYKALQDRVQVTGVTLSRSSSSVGSASEASCCLILQACHRWRQGRLLPGLQYTQRPTYVSSDTIKVSVSTAFDSLGAVTGQLALPTDLLLPPSCVAGAKQG